MATISVFVGFPARTGIPASQSWMVRAVRCLAVRRHRLGIRLVLALAAVLMTGGCRVDATVEADVHDSGGGTVTARFSLDREALAVLGAPLSDGAQTSDLHRAGWTISPVRTRKDGGAQVELSKSFHRPGDLAVVVGELAGPGGPLRGFRLDRRRGLLRTSYRVRGTADVGAGATAATGFANSPDLPARLRDAGVDPDRVAQLLAGRAADGLGVSLVVGVAGRSRSWTLRPGSPVAVDVASSVTDWARPILLAVALLGGATALRRRRRGRHSGGSPASRDATQT